MGYKGIYPLVNIQKAIENGPVEIVSFPIKSMVIFHSYVSLPEGKHGGENDMILINDI